MIFARRSLPVVPSSPLAESSYKFFILLALMKYMLIFILVLYSLLILICIINVLYFIFEHKYFMLMKIKYINLIKSLLCLSQYNNFILI